MEAYTLEGGRGASIEVITYGGIVRSLCVPDRRGRVADVVLGFDKLDPYLADHPYFGAITGRVAGRIPGARFTVGGVTCELAKNDGPNHLHGGWKGLDKRLWKAVPVERADGADSLLLGYHSPDGEEGYPGTVDFSVTYTFTSDNVFEIESVASSDRLTPVSLTNHSYFNLAGEGSGDIFDHDLTVFAERAFLVDEILTPLGRTVPVGGTVGDFSSPRRLGDAVPHLFQRHGDCYQLPGGDSLSLAARVRDPVSGRELAVSTTESCLQIYTSAYLECASSGKSGRAYLPYTGLCLECHGYPAAVQYPEFGSILVEPGRPQRRATRYAFSAG